MQDPEQDQQQQAAGQWPLCTARNDTEYKLALREEEREECTIAMIVLGVIIIAFYTFDAARRKDL